MTITTLACGPLAVMFEVDDTASAVKLARWVRARSLEGVVDVVPAARTVLVSCRRGVVASVEAAVGDYRPGSVADDQDGALVEIPLVEIPVVYDGADLAQVAASVGRSVAEVIEIHTDTTYVGAFCGFTPGFTYLTGLDSRLQLPRRPTPRSRVPAGSVAIGAEFTGVYPTACPGGWHLLGRTRARMWDASRPRPALVFAGCTVRFVREDLPTTHDR